MLARIKALSIRVGAYSLLRWLERNVLRPSHKNEFDNDVKLYRSLIPKESLCFDVGANVGKKSEALLAAGATVVAFEPNQLVTPELHARCKNKGNFRLVTCGLGRGPAILQLYARRNHGHSGFVKGWAENVIGSFCVPVVTLDAAIEAFGRPFFIKIDVEGWENEVISGLNTAIPLISFEFHLAQERMPHTLSCISHLRQFGESKVNLCAGERTEFLLDEWVPLSQFAGWFPGDLDKRMNGVYYGDIYVRNENAMRLAS
jgi:FkbM family methyltransferase